jgi:hypothetical protein
MEPQVTETEFTCKLITIRSKKSFAEVTSALEGLFRMVDLPKLASMTEAGDQVGIKGYFQEISGDHEFSIFLKLDQGSTQRLAGFPLDCRLYLIGNAVIVNRLFQIWGDGRTWRAGVRIPASGGACAHRSGRAHRVLQPVP